MAPAPVATAGADMPAMDAPAAGSPAWPAWAEAPPASGPWPADVPARWREAKRDAEEAAADEDFAKDGAAAKSEPARKTPRSDALRGIAERPRMRRSGASKARTRPPPRERFVETAYWNPAVVTGKDGKATRQVPRPGRALGVPLHRPGRHRRRHARRPGDGRPGRPQGLLRRPQDARRRSPRGTSPGSRREVHHQGVDGAG